MLTSIKNLPVYDLFVIAFLLFCMFRGGMRGFFSQLVSIVALVASWYLASRYGDHLEPYIPLKDPLKGTVAILVTFILLVMGIRILSKMIGGMFSGAVFKEINRQMGALVGLVKGCVICLIITFFAVIACNTTKNMVIGSQSGRIMVRTIFRLQKVIPDGPQHAQVREALDEFAKAAGNEEDFGETEEYQIDSFKEDIANIFQRTKEEGEQLKQTANQINSFTQSVNSFRQNLSGNSSGTSAANGPVSSSPSVSKQDEVLKKTDSIFSRNSFRAVSPVDERSEGRPSSSSSNDLYSPRSNSTRGSDPSLFYQPGSYYH